MRIVGGQSLQRGAPGKAAGGGAGGVARGESDAPRGLEAALGGLLARGEEQRAAERRLLEQAQLMRAVSELGQDAMFALDRDLRCIVVNVAGARLFGRTPDQIIGAGIETFMPGEFARSARARDARVLTTGQASVHEETIDLGGVTHALLITRSPWVVDGAVAGVIGVARDVTERAPSDRMRDRRVAASRAAELTARAKLARLEAQNRRLRERDRVKDDLLALTSHDLRTPLTSIKGHAALLLASGDLDPQSRRRVEVIDRNADRVLALVEGVLLLAQHDTGAVAARPRVVDLSELAGESVSSLTPLAERKRVALVRARSGPMPIRGDPESLGRMLDNLVANAVNYVDEGGHVEVSLTRRDGSIAVRVRDDGPGIAPADHARIFERFTRGRDAPRESTRGFGLGLPIAKAIAETHGGTIGVDSTPGTGATFWVHLPAADEPPTTRHDDRPPPQPLPAPGGPGRRPRPPACREGGGDAAR